MSQIQFVSPVSDCRRKLQIALFWKVDERYYRDSVTDLRQSFSRTMLPAYIQKSTGTGRAHHRGQCIAIIIVNTLGVFVTDVVAGPSPMNPA